MEATGKTEEEVREEQERIKAEAALNAEMKAKYGAIEKITSTDGKHTLWLKQPSRLAVGIFLGKVDSNPVDACEVIFNDAVIQEVSDVAFYQQDENFYGILLKLQTLVRVKKSTFTTL